MKLRNIICRKEKNSEIEYYTLVFDGESQCITLNIGTLSRLLDINKSKLVTLLRKFNASLTNMPYFIEENDAQKATDYFNGLYVAKVLIDGGE